MKATIITLALTGLIALSNIGNAAGKNKTYSSTIIDPINNTETTTICEGKADKYLKPISKTVKTYDEGGKILERTSYQWNKGQNTWGASFKQKFIYADDNKTLEVLSYFEWNKKTKSWIESSIQWIYLSDSESNPLSLAQE